MSEETANAIQAVDYPAKKLALIVYALQAAGFILGITFIAAVVVNYIKKDDVKGSWVESHFRWQIRTFWFSLLYTVIGVILSGVLIGFAVLAANMVWTLYRVIKGCIRLSEGREMYAESK